MEFLSINTFIFLLLANLFVLRAYAAQNTINGFLECLNSHSNQISNSSRFNNLTYTPQNSPSYSSLFQSSVRNLRPASTSRQRPRVIITPTHESEIQAAIYCSRRHDVQIRVRSGGHDFEGLSYISGIPFVILDMRNFQSISIDTEENTAWVQTGVQLGQLYYTIAQHNRTLAFPAGVCPTVGVGGHISGGGYGMISRRHGLALDHIIDAILIDANGQILNRTTMGEDLFWAIRGGGSTSFGIIVAFKLELVVVPPIVTVFNVSRTLEQDATQIVHRWQYISDKIDENLLLRIFLRSAMRPDSDGGRTIVASFTALFLGRVQDLISLMDERFPELGLVEQDCTEMSWIESTLFFTGLPNEPLDVLLNRTQFNAVYFKGKSDYVRQPIPEQALRGIWNFLNEDNDAELQFSPYGGVLNTISESETPFPHRAGNIYMIQYLIIWSKDENTRSERYLNWTRRLYRYMAPYVSKSPRAAYFNYKDLDLGMNNQGNTSFRQASVWGFKYYKNNFYRLVRVKTEVDPSNFFRNEQSVPPLSSS